MTEEERRTPPEGVTDAEGCGEWYATHDEETGGFKRVWDKGYLTLEEARACYQHEHTEHGKKAVKFAERIGSDRLNLRRGYAVVCCNCADDVCGTDFATGSPSCWPTFGGLKYTFGEDGSHKLSVSRDRSFYVVTHKTLTAIIDAADWAVWEFRQDWIHVHQHHAELACHALSDWMRENHEAAIALAEIQRALMLLWRPESLLPKREPVPAEESYLTADLEGAE